MQSVGSMHVWFLQMRPVGQSVLVRHWTESGSQGPSRQRLPAGHAATDWTPVMQTPETQYGVEMLPPVAPQAPVGCPQSLFVMH